MNNKRQKSIDAAVRLLTSIHDLKYDIENPSIQQTVLNKFNLTLTEQESILFKEKIQEIKAEKTKPSRLFALIRFFTNHRPLLKNTIKG